MTIFSPIKLSTKAILIGQYMETETGKISPSLAGTGWAIKQAGIGLQNLGFDEAKTETYDAINGQNFGAAVEADGDESVGAFAIVPAVIAGAKVAAPIIGTGVLGGVIAYTYSKIFGDEMEPDATDVLTGNNVSHQASFDIFEDKKTVISADADDELVGAFFPVGLIAVGVGYGIGVVGKATVVGGIAYGVKRGLDAVFGDEMEPDAAEGNVFNGEFSTNPETLSPLYFNSELVTDSYQQQDARKADLIGGHTNPGMNPYQAQETQYAVLA